MVEGNESRLVNIGGDLDLEVTLCNWWLSQVELARLGATNTVSKLSNCIWSKIMWLQPFFLPSTHLMNSFHWCHQG